MQPEIPSRSVTEHRDIILAGVTPRQPRRFPLSESLGLVLAEDVTAQVDVPSFDNSSMDGYAVHASDLVAASPATPVVLDVVADLPAGTAENPHVPKGSAARIMTGAPVPADTDAIVPVEGTDGGTERVVITEVHRPGAFIRKRASDVRHADVVLSVGTRLGPKEVAAAVATGNTDVLAYRAPRVAIISTGSELVGPGEPLQRGTIHDSNGILLESAARSMGATVVASGRVVDDEAQLHQLMNESAAIADLVIVTGGASVGAYDVVKSLFGRLGAVQFASVRMQPGKPQGFGHWTNGVPVLCFPGNPVSAYVSFEVFARPALAIMSGGTPEFSQLTGTASEGWMSPQGRTQFMPVRIERTYARGFPELSVSPSAPAGSASHLVAHLALADALAIVEEDQDRVHPGDRLGVLLLGHAAP